MEGDWNPLVGDSEEVEDDVDGEKFVVATPSPFKWSLSVPAATV